MTTVPVRADLTDAWLVIVDPQVIFADPSSDWAAPRFGRIVSPLRRLVAEFGDRVIVTRWVTPPDKPGSWGPYFERWSFADLPATDPAFDLVREVAELGIRHTVTEPTFGKWGEQLRAITGDHPTLVVTGVATDCCVIATAIPAADGGATVVVVDDACAGSDDVNHERALGVMAVFDPQIVVRSTADVLAARASVASAADRPG